MTYQERFRSIIMRMKNDPKRYNDINVVTNNSDEEEVVAICKRFWGNSFNDPSGLNVRDDLNPCLANKLLDELELLLDKMNWNK